MKSEIKYYFCTLLKIFFYVKTNQFWKTFEFTLSTKKGFFLSSLSFNFFEIFQTKYFHFISLHNVFLQKFVFLHFAFYYQIKDTTYNFVSKFNNPFDFDIG